MKTLIKISFLIFLLYSLKSNAQNYNQIEAFTDNNCINKVAEFKVTKLFLAYNFNLKLDPKWDICDNSSDADYNVVGIRTKVKRTYLYQFFIYRNGETKESSDLTKFILGPGEYELVISSNPGNSVRLSFNTGTNIGQTLGE